MPGRSTLMTSKRSVSAGRTAVKSRRELPRPCSSRSGSPEPFRVRDSGAVTRWESSIVLLMHVVSKFWILGRGAPPSRVGGSSLRCRCTQRFARQGRSLRRHEHRSPVQIAAGLPALSRCAIPHEMVTTDRVANSHNIIRSSRRGWCPSGGVGLGRRWGRAARCLVCVRPSLSGAARGRARRATAFEPPPAG